MKAIICDHCGEICSEEATQLVVRTPKIRKTFFLGTEKDVDIDKYELCKNCAFLFKKWLYEKEADRES